MHIEDSDFVPVLYHQALGTTFSGVVHPLSTSEAPVHQFRGIKYGYISDRFRQAKLVTSYPLVTDATNFGPICPQVKTHKSLEECFSAIPDVDLPKQYLRQNEFECLNLNITCPVGLTPHSRLPVMVWVHGGGDRGSGSHWLYDGGAFVQRSILLGKPVILVSFNYRLGLFGSAAGPKLREDNKAAGDSGVGNYGLRDQRRAFDWIHHFIDEFGGDPHNVTLFGASTGAADIISHLLSVSNETRPLFHRAIIQSAIIEPAIPDVHTAGWHLSKFMSSIGVSTIEELREVEPEKLVAFGQTLRAVDDGHFFRQGWSEYFSPRESPASDFHSRVRHTSPSRRSTSRHPSHRNHRSTSRALVGGTHLRLSLPSHLQPLIIGDNAADSALWTFPISHWSPSALIRRLKAVVQSLTKTHQLLHAYDIDASLQVPHEEFVERAMELVGDTRVSWPVDCVAENARKERGGRGVWRYVWDQEGPMNGRQHYAADLLYLFDNAPLPESIRPSTPSLSMDPALDFPESFSDSDDDSDDIKFSSVVPSDGAEDSWVLPSVDEFSYARVRDTIQSTWLSFAYAQAPWGEDKVFVFGPEGETGERSSWIFEGRRRRKVWKEVLGPIGMTVAQKLGVEICRGPPLR